MIPQNFKKQKNLYLFSRLSSVSGSTVIFVFYVGLIFLRICRWFSFCTHLWKNRRPSGVNNSFESLLLLQFSINLNQTWQKVRTHGGAKNVGSRILNFCLWVEKSRRLCQFLSIYSNRYSSYVSQPILTKLGTKLEPIGRQKMLGAEFWILLLGGKKQTTLSSFAFFQIAALLTVLMQS